MSRVDRMWNRRWLIRLTGVFTVLVGAVTVTAADAAFSDTSGVVTTVATNQLAPPNGAALSQTCAPPPPVVFRGAMSNSGTDAVYLVVPSGVQAGDVLVAQVSNYGGVFSGVIAPSGWTLVGRATSGGAVTEAVYWKIAGSAEPVYYGFSLSGSPGVQMAGGMAAYGGVDRTAPVNAFGTATGAGATASTPSVTTTVANTVLVHSVSKRRDDLPAPAGTTQLWRQASGNGSSSEDSTGSYESFAGPGSTPVRTTSTGFTSEWVTHTMALRPVPGTPSVTGNWIASSSTWATGYVLERVAGGVVEATGTLTPLSATSATDGPLSNGVTYTYRVSTYFRSWTSTPATATLTTNC